MKRITLLLLLLSVGFQNFANTYSSFLALAKAPVKFNHIVRKFHAVHTQDNVGHFIWINTAGAVTTIPGIRIQNPTNLEGHWIRAKYGDVYTVKDFGASNQVPFVSFAGHGINQTELNSIYGSLLGNGTITTTDGFDQAAMMVAANLAGTTFPYNTIKFTPNVYWCMRSIVLPGTYTTPVSGGDKKMIEIDLNNAQIRYRGVVATKIFDSTPPDQTTANNVWTNTAYYIHDGLITSDNTTTGVYGINIGATYHSVFERLTITGTDYGIYLRFCLNATIFQCSASGGTMGIALDYGNWTGASVSNSQCNGSVVNQCKIRGVPGGTGVYIRSADAVIVQNTIIEGHPSTMDYGIHWDNAGNGAVPAFEVENIHIEIVCTLAGIRAKLMGVSGLINIHAPYSQYAMNLVEVESNAYPEVTFSGLPAIIGGTTFGNKNVSGGEVTWKFINNTNQFGAADWDNFIGFFVAGSNVITLPSPCVNCTQNMATGRGVSSAALPENTSISSINPDVSITLSKNSFFTSGVQGNGGFLRFYTQTRTNFNANHPYNSTAWKTGAGYSQPTPKYDKGRRLNSDYRCIVIEPILMNEDQDYY